MHPIRKASIGVWSNFNAHSLRIFNRHLSQSAVHFKRMPPSKIILTKDLPEQSIPENQIKETQTAEPDTEHGHSMLDELPYDFPEYSSAELDRITEYKSKQTSSKKLSDSFIKSGFAYPTTTKSAQLVSPDDLFAISELKEMHKTKNPFPIESIPSWSPYKKDEGHRSYVKDIRSSKSSDFLWALQNKMLYLKDGDNFIQSRFNYLNNCMSIVNDQQHVLISTDVKVVNNQIREIGIVIYDPSVNKDPTFPVFERYHIIIQEFYGILSTNTYHGESFKLSSQEAFKFLNRLIEKYHILKPPGEGAKFVGHSILDTIKALRKNSVILPTNKDDLFDIYLIYMIPFLYQQKKNIDTSLNLNSFLGLESILRRLQIPHSDIDNVGNRAYFSMIALMTLTNPYHRIKYKLDNIDTNLKYMEKVLQTELDDILKNWNTRSHIGSENSTHSKPAVSTYKDYTKALKFVYDEEK